MKKYKRRKNKNRIFIKILLFLIIVAAGLLLYKNLNANVQLENANNDNEKNEASNIDTQNSVMTVGIDTDNSNKKDIDFLKDLNEPVYKKSEKDIKIPILIYHAFRTPIPDADKYKLFSNQANFDENISTLKNAGYTFITLEELYQYNKGEIGLPEKVSIITMDDGWSGCYTEAYPVLQKYNVPATIFIVNALVGTTDYFNWDQAKEMYDSGLVKIHCHGYKHIAYDTVDEKTLKSDYQKSQKEIIEHLGDDSIQKIMAYPAGKSSDNSIKWLKEIGFDIQVQTKYGTVNKSKNLDLTNLGRIRAERATGKQILSTINAASL